MQDVAKQEKLSRRPLTECPRKPPQLSGEGRWSCREPHGTGSLKHERRRKCRALILLVDDQELIVDC
jgi:hypothetical protein